MMYALQQIPAHQWLANEVVHACRVALLFILFENIGSHTDDWQIDERRDVSDGDPRHQPA